MQAALSSEYSSTPKYASFETGWYPEWLEFANGKKMCPSYAFIDDTTMVTFSFGRANLNTPVKQIYSLRS